MPPSGLAILIGAGPVAGAGIARILASPQQGNLAVALLSRTADPNLASQISQTCHGGPGVLKAFKSDTSEEQLSSVFEEIKKWKDSIDADLKLKLSVFNIKHSHKVAFEEETAKKFTDSLTIYVTGAMVFSQLSLKWMLNQYPSDSVSTGMQKRGTIVFTSTLGSLRTNPGFAAYGATRASVRMLAQSLAREYSAKGIHVVHAIANGGITDKVMKYETGEDGKVSVNEGGEDAEKVKKGERMKAESVGRLYLNMMLQDCDLWVHELDMRPAAEKF